MVVPARLGDIKKWLEENVTYLPIKDDRLHHMAALKFLKKSLINTESRTLKKFSERYDKAIYELELARKINLSNGMVAKAERVGYGGLDIVSNEDYKGLEIECFYIISFSNGCKIGMAKNLKKRIGSYIKPWCRPIYHVLFAEVDDIHIFEQATLEIFKSMGATHNATEFIKLPLDKVYEIILKRNKGLVFKNYIITHPEYRHEKL